MAKKIRLRLMVDVTYRPNGVAVDHLTAMLRHIADYAAGNGMMTGYTEAEVDTWSAKVEAR